MVSSGVLLSSGDNDIGVNGAKTLVVVLQIKRPPPLVFILITLGKRAIIWGLCFKQTRTLPGLTLMIKMFVQSRPILWGLGFKLM